MSKTKASEGRKGQVGRFSRYDISFRREVALQYRRGNRSLSEVATYYGLKKEEVRYWVKLYSDELWVQTNNSVMTESEKTAMMVLRSELEEAKQQLEYEQMKNFALETMIDLAQTELGVDLRKNSGAKQPGE